MIKEPTAAAIAYSLNVMNASMKRVFVLNLGGGILDLSILQIQNGKIEILATKVYPNLSASDIDKALVLHCYNDLKQKFGVDLTKSQLAVSRLCKQCKKAKHELSFNEEVFIECEDIIEEIDYSIRLSREEFEQIVKLILNKVKVPIVNILNIANVEKDEIEEVIMVGGSTRIPKL